MAAKTLTQWKQKTLDDGKEAIVASVPYDQTIAPRKAVPESKALVPKVEDKPVVIDFKVEEDDE